MKRIKLNEDRVDITDLIEIKREYKLDREEYLSMIRSNPDKIDVSVRDWVNASFWMVEYIILQVIYAAKLEDQ